jgi:hypothetical protein
LIKKHSTEEELEKIYMENTKDSDYIKLVPFVIKKLLCTLILHKPSFVIYVVKTKKRQHQGELEGQQNVVKIKLQVPIYIYIQLIKNDQKMIKY